MCLIRAQPASLFPFVSLLQGGLMLIPDGIALVPVSEETMAGTHWAGTHWAGRDTVGRYTLGRQRHTGQGCSYLA